jgi:ATP-dependent DNA ligase
MATLSLRRLWTMYKRVAVEARASKRDLIRTQLAFYSGARGVLKILAYLHRAGRLRGVALDHPTGSATDRKASKAPSPSQNPLSVNSRKAPQFAVPMAALTVKKLPEGEEWIYELKWDGYRALLIKDGEDIHICSRNDKELTPMYPAVVSAARRHKSRQFVLDGELVALGEDGRPSFQALQHRSSHQKHQIVFCVFDALYADGKDLTGEPLERRRARLYSRSSVSIQ